MEYRQNAKYYRGIAERALAPVSVDIAQECLEMR